MACKHKTGDYIHEMWVCAECFRPLHAKPVAYGISIGLPGKGETRQTVVWQADIAKDVDGTTFGKFVLWMVGYLRLRSLWTISKDEARQQCLEVLRDQGEPFGSDDACWTKDDAKELVREGICAYWDEGPSGANI